MHPEVDFNRWAAEFPLESFFKTSGPRMFDSTEPDDPVDLWKPSGAIITSPANLCEVELVRKEYEQTKNLGRAVPVDMFLWSVEPHAKTYLTKLGGVPHRESTQSWPKDDTGKPYTFVAQFCFVDSLDIVAHNLPGEILLIFFRGADSIYNDEEIHLEWSSVELASPTTLQDCPRPTFTVPRLYGHIYRTNDYPDSQDVFSEAGHDQPYLFAETQATKIGRAGFIIQNDPRQAGEELLCVLNSVHPAVYPPGAKWPFIGLESLPDDWDHPADHYEWGKYRMMFADVGCLYFLINKQGEVRWEMSSY